MSSSEKDPYTPPLPTVGIGNSREGGFSKAPKVKSMYEAKLEFPEGGGGGGGGGGHRAIPFH